jgi:hypothetical protein
MKKLFIILLAISISMIFISCRKCSTCTIKDKKTDAVLYVMTEKCGNSSDVDDYESNAKETYPDSIYIVNCIRQGSKN